CVAAPVFNARNELTAAISVVGTRLQINEENLDYLAGKAIACALCLSLYPADYRRVSPDVNTPHIEHVVEVPVCVDTVSVSDDAL
ncbi:hypothetical protein MJL48_31280, partial [Salmonella enterica subsp. enterica serovar Kentucky]|nr:hypothetical protein [Salmonella enterica subsp. enterica serovar Kentucky]